MKKIFVALMCAVAVIATSVEAKAQKNSGETVVNVSFRNADDTKSVWPFAEKRLSNANPVTECTLTTKKGGHAFEFSSTQPVYVNSKYGLMFGGEPGNYLKFPAVKGKTLTKISIKFGGKGSMGTPTIVDMKGNVLEGGKGAKSKDMNYVHTWNISGLKKGKPAKMLFTTAGGTKIKSIELSYE